MKSSMATAALVAALVLCAPAFGQQNQLPTQSQQSYAGGSAPVQPLSTLSGAGNAGAPVPAARGLFVGDNNGTAVVEPDDSLLTGVESFSLGVLHSFTTLFDPSFFVTESAQTGVTTGSSWDRATSVGGGLALMRDWNHVRFTTQYFGADSFYSPGAQYGGSYQDLSVSQSARFGRWSTLLRDDFGYTLGTNFGGFQTSSVAPSSGEATGSSLQSGLSPSETIATGNVGTINNTAVAQASYSWSHRTAFTFAGAYGLLTFDQPGYIDSATETASVGYNYALSRLDNIAALYTYGQDNFNGSAARAVTHTAQAAFGRRITGRLAMQVAAGPQIEIYKNAFGIQNGSQLSWAASGGVTYGPRPRRTSYALMYSHGLTSGSGVFYGAENDSVTGSVRLAAGRSWTGALNVGFASTRALAGSAGFGATRYGSWYSGANVNRTIGRQLAFSMTYEYLHQNANGTCPVASCGVVPNPQTLSARIQWHPFPAHIE